MASDESRSGVSELMSAPLGDLIAAVGRGLSDAQRSLDQGTIDALRALYSGDDPAAELMRRMGYQPTWYRIPELSAEITMSLSVSGQEASSLGGRGEPAGAPVKLYAAPIDASYTNRYDYDLKAASVVRFKIVPVPGPAQLSDGAIVPRLVGRRWSEATAMLAELGIAYRADPPGFQAQETSLVTATTPAAGGLLRGGEALVLSLR